MEDKILRMFFDIGRWEHAIDKGVDKDIRKDQLLRLTDERTRLAMAEAMMQPVCNLTAPYGPNSQRERRIPHRLRERAYRPYRSEHRQ